LGGGTPCYANNMKEINKGDTVSIYLQGKTKTMIDRLIKKKSKRPLIASLADDKISEFVSKHLFERLMYYELAKITVKIDAKTKKEIAKKLKKILN
jgi:shikimate kinase